MDQRHHSWTKWQAAGCALAITLVQLGLACALSGQARPLDAYRSLRQWDSGWYGVVAASGYDLGSHDHVRVAFFPGYPLSARLVMACTRLTPYDAILLTAQLECWGFWTYFLLLLRRWRISRGLAFVAVVAVLVHPSAFFMVSGYSEPLYLLAFIGFMYWAERSRPSAAPLAALHGVLMTATRFIGMPLVIYPVVRAWMCGERRISRLAVLASSGLIGLLGVGLYFGYCWWQTGRWDCYFRVEAQVWGAVPHYLAPFTTQVFRIRWPALTQPAIDPEYLSRLSVLVTWLIFLTLGFVEYRCAQRLESRWRERIGIYLAAALTFYVSVSGHAPRDMSSMIRYVLCVQVLLSLAVVHLLARTGLPKSAVRQRALVGLGMAWCCISFACQLALTYRFTRGLWVA